MADFDDVCTGLVAISGFTYGFTSVCRFNSETMQFPLMSLLIGGGYGLGYCLASVIVSFLFPTPAKPIIPAILFGATFYNLKRN